MQNSYERTSFRMIVLCLGLAPLIAAADFRDIFIDPGTYDGVSAAGGEHLPPYVRR